MNNVNLENLFVFIFLGLSFLFAFFRVLFKYKKRTTSSFKCHAPLTEPESDCSACCGSSICRKGEKNVEEIRYSVIDTSRIVT